MKRLLLLATGYLLLATALFAQSRPSPTQPLTLLVSAARTATGTSTTTSVWRYSTCQVVLNVTAAATEAGDTLDVFLEKSADGGTTWDTFTHFTQVLGNGGAKKFIALVSDGIAPTLTTTYAPKAHADVAASAINQGAFGDYWRIAFDIVDVATLGNQSFTFSVKANCK